jgi:hypothetical protein
MKRKVPSNKTAENKAKTIAARRGRNLLVMAGSYCVWNNAAHSVTMKRPHQHYSTKVLSYQLFVAEFVFGCKLDVKAIWPSILKGTGGSISNVGVLVAVDTGSVAQSYL